MNWLAVFIGGGLGSLLRYAFSIWGKSLFSQFPVGTLGANLLACILLGIIVWFMQSRQLSSGVWYAFLAVGFCGGFSTFSTFSLETVELIRNGSWPLALLNASISVVAGVAALWYVVAKS